LGNDQTVPLLGEAFGIVMRQPGLEDRIFPVTAQIISDTFVRGCKVTGIEALHFHDIRNPGLFVVGVVDLSAQHAHMAGGYYQRPALYGAFVPDPTLIGCTGVDLLPWRKSVRMVVLVKVGAGGADNCRSELQFWLGIVYLVGRDGCFFYRSWCNHEPHSRMDADGFP
jgi:hypothetical protein